MIFQFSIRERERECGVGLVLTVGILFAFVEAANIYN